MVEQFAFSDLAIGARIDREAARPTWASAPPNWQVRQMKMGAKESVDTGWVVMKLPPGFVKIMEGRRDLGDRPDALAQIVFSDGLVAVSVFIDKRGGPQRHVGRARQGGLNQFSIKQDDYVITALGEAPPEVVEAIAMSVTRR